MGDFYESMRIERLGCDFDQLFLYYAQQGGLYLPEHFLERIEQIHVFHVFVP